MSWFDLSGLFEPVWRWLADMHLGSPPQSTIFVLGVSVILALITLTANKFLVDVKKLKELREEVSAWQREFNQARRSGDKQAEMKLKRKQARISQLQATLLRQQMKLMLIFFAPFAIIFYALSGFYDGRIVVWAPYWLPFITTSITTPKGVEYGLQFFWWYLISSFTVNLPMTRLLGLSYTGD
jgi:uncharacterized membrane protein (DUF106 family)